MTAAEAQHALHETDLSAPAALGYGLIADVTQWPLLFPPCLAARVLERSPGEERVRLWALAGGEVRTWTSVRQLDAERLRVGFRQDEPSPPVLAMSGSWSFVPALRGAGHSRLTLAHEWEVGGPAEVGDQIAVALDHNSRAEIDAVRSWTERADPPEELLFSFSDQLPIKGEPHDVYTFLHRADRWPEYVPHVVGLNLRTDAEVLAGAEVQRMEMATAAPDGTTHHSNSVRLCFPSTNIIYKQTTPPRGLLGHTGEWTIAPSDEGCVVTAGHRVALDPAALSAFAGPGHDLAQARRVVRQRLGGNSMRTLEQARSFVEGHPRSAMR